MSAKTRTLLELKEVTDHDCGNYKVGEIDFALHYTLDEYLKLYGYEGKKEIIHTLGVLSALVQNRFLDIQETNNGDANNG